MSKNKPNYHKTKNEDDKKRLRAELYELIEQNSEIIQQMSDIKFEIGKLETKQESYLDMLTIAKTNKKAIEKDLKNISISSLLNEFEITN